MRLYSGWVSSTLHVNAERGPSLRTSPTELWVYITTLLGLCSSWTKTGGQTGSGCRRMVLIISTPYEKMSTEGSGLADVSAGKKFSASEIKRHRERERPKSFATPALQIFARMPAELCCMKMLSGVRTRWSTGSERPCRYCSPLVTSPRIFNCSCT